jgi:hypothetical protein
VADFDDFIRPGEDDVVLPDDGAAPDGAQADLMLAARAAQRMTVVHGFRLIRQDAFGGAVQHQGRAAGGVDFGVVVPFDDFDVVI